MSVHTVKTYHKRINTNGNNQIALLAASKGDIFFLEQKFRHHHLRMPLRRNEEELGEE